MPSSIPNYLEIVHSYKNLPSHWKYFWYFMLSVLESTTKTEKPLPKTKIDDDDIDKYRNLLTYILDEYYTMAMATSMNYESVSARKWWTEEENPIRTLLLESLDLDDYLPRIQQKIQQHINWIKEHETKLLEETLQDRIYERLYARIKERFKKEYGFALNLDFRINDIPRKEVGNETYLDYGKSVTGEEKILVVPTTWITENILHFPSDTDTALLRFEYTQNGKKRLRKEIDITSNNYMQSISL